MTGYVAVIRPNPPPLTRGRERGKPRRWKGEKGLITGEGIVTLDQEEVVGRITKGEGMISVRGKTGVKENRREGGEVITVRMTAGGYNNNNTRGTMMDTCTRSPHLVIMQKHTIVLHHVPQLDTNAPPCIIYVEEQVIILTGILGDDPRRSVPYPRRKPTMWIGSVDVMITIIVIDGDRFV